jgi:hypothetical protein
MSKDMAQQILASDAYDSKLTCAPFLFSLYIVLTGRLLAGVFISNFTSRLIVLSNQLSPKKHPTATFLMQVALTSFALEVDHHHVDGRGHACPSWSHLLPLTSQAPLLQLDQQCQLHFPHLLPVISTRLLEAQRQIQLRQASQLSHTPLSTASLFAEYQAVGPMDDPGDIGRVTIELPYPTGLGTAAPLFGPGFGWSLQGTAESSTQLPGVTLSANELFGGANTSAPSTFEYQEDLLVLAPIAPDLQDLRPAVTETEATETMSWLAPENDLTLAWQSRDNSHDGLDK